MVTAQELENAKIDARTIGESVNENKIVTPRYGAPFKSMPMIAEEMQSVIGTIIGGGVPASIVLDGNQAQDEINLYGGKKYDMPAGGYLVGGLVRLDNGNIVRSTVANNIANPNVDMTGWVLYSNEKLRVFNVLDYGADPTGETSSYLAFKKCSEALSSSGSGKYVVPFGIYDCGFQEPPSVGEAWRRIGRYPIDLQELDNVVLDLQGCTLKNPDGMYYGNFNADMTPSGPEHKLNAAYRCGTGALINLVANKVVEITGSATLKGSMGSYIIGGNYGDFGIQIESFGIRLLSNKSFVNNAAIETTDFGEDGVYVADKYKSKAGVWIESTDNTELARHTVSGIRSTFNARQGVSFCGGSGAIEDCYIEGIGKTRLTATLPKAGIDIEQEAGVIRDVTLNRVTVFDCSGVGITTTSGASKRIRVRDSKFIGSSSYSAYLATGVFKNTLFVGRVGTGLQDADLLSRGDYPRYKKCTFSNRLIDSRGLTPFSDSILIEPISQSGTYRAYFEDCDFYTTKGWVWFDGASKFKFKNCRFYIAPEATSSGTISSSFGISELEDCKFYDLRENPTAEIIASRNNNTVGAVWKNVSIETSTGMFRFSWSSVTKGTLVDFGTNPVNRSISLTKDDGIGVIGDSKAGVATVYSRNSVPSSPTTYGNPFVQGDVILNALATTSGRILSLCTTAGYASNTAWAATTTYSVNNYIYSGSRVYKCTVAGISSATAPTHTTGTATDGTVTWEYIGTRAAFRDFGVKGATVANAIGTDDTSTKLNALIASLKDAGVIQ